MAHLRHCFSEVEIKEEIDILRKEPKAPFNGVLNSYLPKFLQEMIKQQNEVRLRKKAIHQLSKLKRECKK